VEQLDDSVQKLKEAMGYIGKPNLPSKLSLYQKEFHSIWPGVRCGVVRKRSV